MCISILIYVDRYAHEDISKCIYIYIYIQISAYIPVVDPGYIYIQFLFILNAYAGPFLEASWDKESAQVAKVWKG